jgi:prepilin-type N-terminal cleavage/methylation domain-containing protein
MELKRIRLSKNKGFTLVELIVVIAILGILLAVGVMNLSGVLANAREQGDIQSLRAMETSIAVYQLNNGGLPASAITNKTTFETAFNTVLPEGVPTVNRSGFKFYYKTSDGGVLCEASSPGADWVSISD